MAFVEFFTYHHHHHANLYFDHHASKNNLEPSRLHDMHPAHVSLLDAVRFDAAQTEPSLHGNKRPQIFVHFHTSRTNLSDVALLNRTICHHKTLNTLEVESVQAGGGTRARICVCSHGKFADAVVAFHEVPHAFRICTWNERDGNKKNKDTGSERKNLQCLSDWMGFWLQTNIAGIPSPVSQS